MACGQNRDGKGVTRTVGHAGSAKVEAYASGARDSTWNHGSGLGEILGKDWGSRSLIEPAGRIGEAAPTYED